MPRRAECFGQSLLSWDLGGAKDQMLRLCKWYLKSAAQAHSPAQVNVARMYRLGLGVKRDVMRSFAWLLQARAKRQTTRCSPLDASPW